MQPILTFLLLAVASGPTAASANSEGSLPLKEVITPKALSGEPGPATAGELRNLFKDPSAEYRSMPLWVWNDRMEVPRIEEQLQQYQEQGMGGVFVHPRPGLKTEYLSEEWFSLWKHSLAVGKRLGLLVNIYDENSYPSGFAGGHVPSLAPDTASQFVQARKVPKEAIRPQRGNHVAYFALSSDPGGSVRKARLVRSPGEVLPEEEVWGFLLRRASGNPWTGEFPYVDLTNPRTAEVFLETTYERYRKELGSEFGKVVRWAFTDEPLISTGGAYDQAELALPLSYYSLSEFQKRNGYDLRDEIASLFWDVGAFQKVRFDYWQTIHDLWKENFLQPIYEWCDRNSLQFTGHWMEHEWPYPWITPADASLYAFEHIPGIDMLEGTKLRLTGKDPHMLFTIKQVASVSHQLGRRTFCEAYGVAGWDSTFEHYKRFGDWLMVHGVNFMNQHLSFSTIQGARKRDHPQSFSDVASWWPHYRHHADHLARVSLASARGESRNRILLLQSTTSGFLHARRAGPTPELAEMRERNSELIQFLADHQVDFDLGDEYMIEWFGGQEPGSFRIGRANYSLLIWPPDMVNLRSQTLPHLRRFLEQGGEILALSEPARFIDGRPSNLVTEMAAKAETSGRWHRMADLATLREEIQKRLKPRIRFDRALPSGVGFLEKHLADGSRIILITNSGLERVSAKALVEAGSIGLFDTENGSTRALACPRSGKVAEFDVSLAPAGSLLVLAEDGRCESLNEPPVEWKAVSLSVWESRPDSLNVLVLDYCDLNVGGESLENLNTWEANWTIWQKHGFERPAWDNAIQFKTSVFDRNRFSSDSGFSASFRFVVDQGVPLESLELAVETPQLYSIFLNGNPLNFKDSQPWLDPHLRSVGIGGLVHYGENQVTLRGQPFDVEMEFENIYVLGDFSLASQERGFRAVSPRPLAIGSWARQGYPFFSQGVTYLTAIEVPSKSGFLQVTLKDWQGSLVTVTLDGKEVGILAWPPYSLEVPVSPGAHNLAVKVISTPRNLFGPFHNPAKLRMRAWPAAWADFPRHQPEGASYDVLDYGLLEPPMIRLGSQQGAE